MTLNTVRAFGLAVIISLAAWSALTASGIAATARAGSAASANCRRPPVVSGQLHVSGLRNISAATACRAAIAFQQYWYHNNQPGGALYGCHGYDPYLKLHSWKRWHLSIHHTFEFTMSRARESFVVSGQDFPFTCF